MYVILKEHQITTVVRFPRHRGGVYVILKEHQITTGLEKGKGEPRVYVILKEHQITTGGWRKWIKEKCTSFSKSIKSQQSRIVSANRESVRHSQRASNHNVSPFWSCQFRVYVILKEHQITTWGPRAFLARKVYVILKEHQITTIMASWYNNPKVYVILKEHQITTGRGRRGPPWKCTSFSKSIKSQQTKSFTWYFMSVRHSQRASNHNSEALVDRRW